jgi:large conductance mechanosensitive channel
MNGTLSVAVEAHAVFRLWDIIQRHMAKKEVLEKAEGFWSDFKAFAVKGNALELAIAVVVGNAFGAIVNSLVANIITPTAGLLTPAGTQLQTFSIVLRPAYLANGTTTPALILQYGTFFSTIVNFFIISLSIFIVFKLLSSARKSLFQKGEQAVPAAQKPPEERLLEEIRDLLKETLPAQKK